jgi:hypothetical protein
MNDIEHEAKSLFAAARNAEPLPGRERARIKRAVLLQVATLGAASTVAGGAVAMSVAAKVTLVAVTAVALGGGSVSLWAWKKHTIESAATARTPATRPIPPVPAASPPVVKQNAEVKAENLFSVPAEPQRRAMARNEVRRPVVGPAPAMEITPAPDPVTKVPSDSLDSELTMLRQAQEDLRLGLPAQALRRLTAYDRRFPTAKLDQERQAIAAIAWCQLHPGPAARTRYERFLQQAPLSPLAPRVRSACQPPDDHANLFNENGPGREQ